MLITLHQFLRGCQHLVIHSHLHINSSVLIFQTPLLPRELTLIGGVPLNTA